MWDGKYSESTLSIQEGWQLILGHKARIPFPYLPGNYNCRTSKQYSGIDICSTDNLFTSKPFILVNYDPYPYSPPLSHQVEYWRDDVTGCRYPDIHFQDPRERRDYDSEYDEDYECESPDPYDVKMIYAEGCGPTKRKTEQVLKDTTSPDYDGFYRDYEYENRTRTRDCVYLGEPFVKGRILKEMVVDGEVYSYKNEEHIVIGYLFTVGIWGSCLDKFNSDEGYYEVAVHTYKDGITLVGKQNMLPWLNFDIQVYGYRSWTPHYVAIEYFNQQIICIQRAYRSYVRRRAERRMALIKDELLAVYYHPSQ